MAYTVILKGGAPWGFRIDGGTDFAEPIQIATVNPNSKAANQGLGSGDHIDSINGERTDGLMHNEALQLIRKANNTLHLQLTKAETKPKLVIPEIRINGPPVTGQLNAQNLSYFDSLSKLTNHEPGIYPTGPTGGGASYQSDGEMSGSTSDSQSSIIQVVEGRKQPLTKPETPPAAMDVSTSGDSGTAPVWSPFGSKSAKGYKPVSFNVSGSPTKSVTQPASGLSFPPSKVSSSPPSHNTVGQSYSSVSVSPHPHPTHPAHPVHSQSSSSSSSASSSVYASSSSKSPLTSSVTPHTTGSSPHPFSPAAVSTKPEPPKPGIKTNALTPMEPQPRKTTTHPSPKAPTPSSSFPTKSRGMSAFLARQYADPEDETEPQTRGEVKPQPVEQARPSTPKPAMLSSSMPTFKPSPPKKFGPAPTAKSRGMALFLNMKEKHATLDEEEEEGTPKITDNGVDATGEGAPVGVSAGISPVVGRAVPIPIKNDVAVAADTKPRGDLHKLSGLGMTNGQASTTVNATVASVTDSALNKVSSQHDKPEGGFVPSAQLSSLSLLDKALEERKREREAARRGGPPPYTAPQSQTFSPAMDGRSMSAGTCTTTTSTATSLPTTTDTHSSWNGSISHFAETKSGLPQPQSATITLLQRNRERRQAQERELHEDETDNNQHVQSLLDKIEQAKLTNDRPLSCGMNGDSHLSSVDGETELDAPFAIPPGINTVMVDETSVPDNAIMVGKRETVEGDKKHYDTFYLLPDEKTVTQTETREIKAPPKLHGIGPKDAKTGIPLTLRKSVDDDSQKDWYRSMYKSLHKMEPGAKDTNPYQPTYAFPEEKSEPKREEPNPYMPSYEYPSSRFHDKENGTMTLDRYTSSSSNRDKSKNWSPPHARYRTEKYKNQPHRIEDYEPGRSSLALRESRLSQRHNPALDKPGDHNKYVDCKTEVEFHKRDRASSPALSDITAHRAYRTVQKGGDIPTSGFGFPQPQKKDYDDDLNYYTDSEAVINPSHNYKSTRKVTLLTRGGGQTSDRGGRGQYERSLSALGRIGDMSPSGYTERERERSYATTPTPSSSGIRYSISDAHNAAERKRREEEAARQRSLDMERLHAQQKQKAQPRKHSSSYSNGVELDRAFCDDKYWLKLAGLDDDGRPVQKSPISLTRFDDRDASSLERPVMKKQTMIRGKARAKYNFKAQNSKELSFHKGDTVYLLRQVDKNWCEGEHHGLIGIFPINYVEVLMSLDEARTAAILREGQAQAKYNFNPQTRKELALKKGEKVTLIRRVDENWYEGRTADEKQGIFPANYVEVMREPDTPMVTPASSFAPTPRTVSPGPMSPVGSIAPTIPSAPMSPRSAFNDDFDLDNFNFEVNATQLTSPSSRSQSRQEYGGGSSSLPNYHSDYSNTALSSSAPQRSMGAYGTMDTKRSTSSLGMGPTRDHYSTERPSSAVPFGMQKSTVITSASLSPSYQLASSSGGRRGAASSVGRGASQSPFGFTDSSLDTRSQEARPVVTPVRDRPLSPYMERTLGVKSPSPSYGKPKEEISKPFEGPSYPAYRSMYNYRPQNKDELELKEGDVVYVIEKCDDGWFVGTSQRTKEIGTFPGNYVHKL